MRLYAISSVICNRCGTIEQCLNFCDSYKTIHEISIKTEPPDDNPLRDFEYLEAPQLSPQFPVQYESSDSLLVPSSECPVSSHGIEDPPERCRVCSKLFSSIGNRIRHERILHHLELDSPRISNSDVDSTSNMFSDADNDESQLETVTPVSLPEKDRFMPLAHQTENDFINYYSSMSEMMKTRLCCCCSSRFSTNKALHAHLRKKMHLELFSCYMCWISFPNISQFISHRSCKAECYKRGKLLNSGDYTFKPYQNYKCNFCTFIFPNETLMKLHLDMKHNNVILPTNCPTCECVLDSLDDFKEHLLSTCIYRIYCGICKQDFPTIIDFDNHCNIHSNDNTTNDSSRLINPASFIKKERKTYDCHLCKNKYTNDVSLLKHLRLFHNDPSVYICKICPVNSSDRFMLRTNLTDHMTICHKDTSIIHVNQQNNFSCNSCGNLFTTLNDWKAHQKSHLINQCDECDEAFETTSNLEEHKTSHANSKLKLKLYRCSNSNLYRTSAVSSRRNSLANQFICQICDKYFDTKKDLHEHLSLHDTMPRLEHLDTAESTNKTYNCVRCDKSYKFKFSLAKHNKNIHGKTAGRRARARSQPPEDVSERVDRNKTERECFLCNIIFKNANALYKHNFKHHSKRNDDLNTSLPILSMENGIQKSLKQLKEEPQLKIKKKTKVAKEQKSVELEKNDKETYCKQCGDTFKSPVGLANHMRVHYRGEVPNTKPRRRKPKIKAPINKELRCVACQEVHDDVESLQQHILTHVTVDMIPEGSTSRKLFPCIHCNKLCLTAPALVNHMKIHDLIAMKKAQRKCGQCGKVVANNAALANHLRLNSCKKVLKKNKLSINTCRVCNKKLPSSHALRGHMKFHASRHGKDIGTSVVKPKSGKNMSSLIFKKSLGAVTIKKTADLVTIKKENPKRLSGLSFSCTRCKIQFPDADILQKHIKMHMKEAKHKLALNNVKLALSNDKQTSNIVDKETTEAKNEDVPQEFNCELCKEVFVSYHSLLSHKGWHKRTGSRQSLSETSSAKPKPSSTKRKSSPGGFKKRPRKFHKYTCVHCKKVYSFLASFKKHLLGEHNESYVAEEVADVPKVDPEPVEVNNDVDTKTKVEKRKSSVVSRNYKCTECNLFFPDAKRLRFHVLSHANTTI